jgi:hypothetical protein
MASDEQIERRMQQLRTIAPQYAKAKAQVGYLEEFKKSKLALLMKAAEAQGATSAAAQERDARCHPDYLELLEGLREATERAEALRWELTLSTVAADVWRSQEASKRAERHGYGNP